MSARRPGRAAPRRRRCATLALELGLAGGDDALAREQVRLGSRLDPNNVQTLLLAAALETQLDEKRRLYGRVLELDPENRVLSASVRKAGFSWRPRPWRRADDDEVVASWSRIARIVGASAGSRPGVRIDPGELAAAGWSDDRLGHQVRAVSASATVIAAW